MKSLSKPIFSLIFLMLVTVSCEKPSSNLRMQTEFLPNSESVTLVFDLNVGEAHDPAEFPGLHGEILHSILYSGTGNRSAEEMMQKMEDLGIKQGAECGWDNSRIVFTYPASVQGKVWPLIRSKLLYPNFDSHMEVHYKRVFSASSRFNVPDELYRPVMNLATGKEPGTGSLDRDWSVHIAELQDSYESDYSIHGLSVYVAGAFSDEFLNTLETDLGQFHFYSRRPEIPMRRLFDQQGEYGSTVLLENDGRSCGDAVIMIPLNIFPYTRDYLAMDILASHLGAENPSGGELSMKIVQKRALAGAVTVSLNARLTDTAGNLTFSDDRDGLQSLFIVLKDINAADLPFISKIVLHTLDRIRQDGISETAFEYQKKGLRAKIALKSELTEYQALRMSDSRYYASRDIDEEIVETLGLLTLDEANRSYMKFIEPASAYIYFRGGDTDAAERAFRSGLQYKNVPAFTLRPEIIREDRILSGFKLNTDRIINNKFQKGMERWN